MIVGKLGHIDKNCPNLKKKFKGRYHASAFDMDDEPQRKKPKESNLDKVTTRHHNIVLYYLYLSRTITNSLETWLVDSTTSRHMIGYRRTLTYLAKKKSSIHFELGDDATYSIKGVESTSFPLDSWIFFCTFRRSYLF